MDNFFNFSPFSTGMAAEDMLLKSPIDSELIRAAKKLGEIEGVRRALVKKGILDDEKTKNWYCDAPSDREEWKEWWNERRCKPTAAEVSTADTGEAGGEPAGTEVSEPENETYHAKWDGTDV